MGYSLNTVSTVVLIYGHICCFARLLFRLASLSAFHKGIDSQAKGKLLPRVPVPPASPESWCPHVQTARPSERSFSPESVPRGSRGPRIYASHTPRQSHTHAAPLLVLKRHFRPHPGAPAEPNHPPW